MEIKIQIECIEKQKDNNYPLFKVSCNGNEEGFQGDLLEVQKEIKAWLLLQMSEIDVLDLLNVLVKE